MEALGKETIDDYTINHRKLDDSSGICDINVYNGKSDPNSGDSVWGYDPGCNCDITSQTSPQGQEGFLERQCYKLAKAKGIKQDYSSQNAQTIALVEEPMHQDTYHAGNNSLPGIILGAALTIAAVSSLLYKTLTLKPGEGLKKEDKK